jgi:hypothetical protein
MILSAFQTVHSASKSHGQTIGGCLGGQFGAENVNKLFFDSSPLLCY